MYLEDIGTARYQVETRSTVVTVQLAPLKVDPETDTRISHLSHFLDQTKKDIVRDAVELLWQAKAAAMKAELDQLNRAVALALSSHDGTTAASVSLLTGLSPERLAELGGVDD